MKIIFEVDTSKLQAKNLPFADIGRAIITVILGGHPFPVLEQFGIKIVKEETQ